MLKRYRRYFHHTDLFRFSLHVLCGLLIIIALCLVFSFLVAHLTSIIGIAALFFLICAIQWFICTLR